MYRFGQSLKPDTRKTSERPGPAGLHRSSFGTLLPGGISSGISSRLGTSGPLVEAIAETIPLLLIGPDLRVIGASGRFHRLFHTHPETANGCPLQEFQSGAWNVPALLEGLKSAMRTGQRPKHIEVEIEADFPEIGKRRLDLKARLLRPGPKGGVILLCIMDVTVLNEELKRTARELRRSEAALQRSQSELRGLASRLINNQEQERARMARELHDELNQRLAMLTIDADRLKVNVRRPEVRTALDALRKGTQELMTDVRRLAHQLHPSILDHLGLEIALRSYCADFSAHEGIQVKYSARNFPGSVRADIGLCLYRVCQESLRNIAKHSGAKRATVALEGTRGEIRLLIQDWGTGFDVNAAKQKQGIGLLSIGERVRLAGGTVTIKSRPGEGSRTIVRIPIEKGAQNE